MLYYLKRIGLFYRGNYQTHGVRGVWNVTAALLLTLLGPLVSQTGRTRRYCPCCGWRGARFLPFLATGNMNFDARCPRCTSHPRHRGHRLFYEKHLEFGRRQGSLLYIAPESNIAYFRDNPSLDVKTSSFPTGDTDFHIDIMNMDVADDSWNYIVCHRVIEHLPDDRLGMREFYRILKPGGMAIVSVPIALDRQHTIEYGEPNPLEHEHYYDYGMDFLSRIPSEFRVETMRYGEMFSTQEFEEMVLFDDLVFVLHKPGP